MTFIKSLGIPVKEKGQASLEYFIIFSVVTLLTILSLSSFLPTMQRTLQGNSKTRGFFQKAIGTKGINVENK